MGQSIRVLHVDDDPGFAEVVAAFLEREDERFTVETATNASDGVNRLEDHSVDCIVSDYDMPGQNGIDFLKTVREDHPDLPFILFTGKGSEEVASTAISAGVSDYLQKGTGTGQYAVLANRIGNLVAKHEAEELVERAYLAMDRSREGIALLDEDGEFVYVNETYCKIVGYEQDDLLGEFWELVYPDEQAERIYRNILDKVAEDGYWSGDTVYQRKDGTRVRVSHALVYSKEGTMICLIRDITESQETRRVVREERQAFELFIDAVEEYAIFMLDPDGYITTWNKGAERIKGYSESEILGNHISTFYTEEQRDRGLPERLLKTAIEEGSAHHQGIRVREDGSTFQADIVITAVYDESGTHRGFGKVTQDVTQQKERERQREQIIERVTDAIVEVDSEWRFTLVNEQAEDLYDMSEESLLGRDFWDVFEKAKGTRFESEYRQVMETREPTSFVEYFSQLDGWFDIEAYPKRDGGIAFYFIEVTEHHEREHALEAECAFISEALDTLDDAFFVVGPTGALQRWNEHVIEVTGYSEAELAEMEARDLFPEHERERVTNAIKTTFETGVDTVEAEISTADGALIPYEFVARRLTDSEGKVLGIAGIGRDLSGRKERETRLKALNETTHRLMTAGTRDRISEIGVEAASTILGLDANAIHLYDDEQAGLVPVAGTDAIFDLVGELPTFTEGDSIAWRVFDHEEALALDDVHDDPDLYNPETPVRSELHLPLGDHGILIAGSEHSEAFDQQDIVFGEILASAIVAALDQADRTEQLRARERELTRQNNRLGEFASIVSHDLRNPLTVAKGRLDLAREECESEHLDDVAQAHDRMVVLIDDLLTLANEGDLVGEREPVNLEELAESCWANVATADATLRAEVARSLHADRSRLQQLLENLFRNAVEHGGDDVTVTLGELEDGFYVEDDGPGIPEAHRDAVFDTGYSTAREGTGFGLSIVRQVADAHDWKVRVTDGSDAGARFEITGVEFAAELNAPRDDSRRT